MDPDITYCVDINSSSEGNIHSQCGIHETDYFYQFSNSFPECAQTTAIITPVNIVGNGYMSSLYLESEEGNKNVSTIIFSIYSNIYEVKFNDPIILPSFYNILLH